MKEPTEVREFWEKCGRKNVIFVDGLCMHDDSNGHRTWLDLDLKNLEKFALPRVQEKGYEITLTYDPFEKKWTVILFATQPPLKDYNTKDANLTDALYGAIKKVLDERTKD